MTNLDQAKTLHIGKGEIVGFARPEMKSVTYVATTNKINIEEYVDTSPRNWIPRGRRKLLVASEDSKKSIYRYNLSQEGGKWCVNTGEKCKKSLIKQSSMNIHEAGVDKAIKRIITGRKKTQVQHRLTVNGVTLMR